MTDVEKKRMTGTLSLAAFRKPIVESVDTPVVVERKRPTGTLSLRRPVAAEDVAVPHGVVSLSQSIRPKLPLNETAAVVVERKRPMGTLSLRRPAASEDVAPPEDVAPVVMDTTPAARPKLTLASLKPVPAEPVIDDEVTPKQQNIRDLHGRARRDALRQNLSEAMLARRTAARAERKARWAKIRAGELPHPERRNPDGRLSHAEPLKDRAGRLVWVGCKTPSIRTAVRYGLRGRIRRYLAEHPTKVDRKTWHDGETLLHTACLHNRDRAARVLLDHGANVNAKSKKGETPLLIAISLGNVDLVRVLLKHGKADPNIRDCNRASPLHRAIRRGNLDIVTLLVEAGADLKSPEPSGDYVVHTIVKTGSPQMCEMLRLCRHHGADVKAVNRERQTAMHIAAKMPQKAIEDVLGYLMTVGVSVKAWDAKNRTALHVAASCIHEADRVRKHGFKMLRRMSPNGMEKRNKNGESPESVMSEPMKRSYAALAELKARRKQRKKERQALKAEQRRLEATVENDVETARE